MFFALVVTLLCSTLVNVFVHMGIHTYTRRTKIKRATFKRNRVLRIIVVYAIWSILFYALIESGKPKSKGNPALFHNHDTDTALGPS